MDTCLRIIFFPKIGYNSELSPITLGWFCPNSLLLAAAIMPPSFINHCCNLDCAFHYGIHVGEYNH